jgi:S1-C subfamily serine protease
MATNLTAISTELAGAVAKAGQSVVAVHARSRWASGGVAWRPGVIVTAEHTLGRDDEFAITLPDGKQARARVAGRDPGTDLAILRTDAAVTPAAQSPATDLQAGHLALAIGRSENSGVNATFGIVSAVSGSWRTWRGGRLDRYIRLDINFFPGTSGGAIVNTAGEAIGVATSALSRIAGLAIPASTVDRVADEILKRGHVARGYLGVGLQPVQLPEHQKKQMGVENDAGLIVLSLETDGPAARAGVMLGDILFALDGKPVSHTDHVQAVLETKSVGQPVAASLIRGGAPVSLAVTIGERPR